MQLAELNRSLAVMAPVRVLLDGVIPAEQVGPLLDERFGIIRRLFYENHLHSFPGVHVFRADLAHPSLMTRDGLPLHFDVEFQQHASGAGFDVRTALVCTVCEAIERYCAITYDERDVVLAKPATLDWPILGLHDLAYYGQQRQFNPNWRYTDIDANAERGWRKGIELGTSQETMIPAELVYLSYRPQCDNERFSQGISTGLACGPNFESAAYTALMEVIERDAAVSTWLLRGSLDRSHPAIAAVLKAHRRHVPEYLDVTLGFVNGGHGIPCAMAILHSKSSHGFVAASSASVLPECALEKSLREALKSVFGAQIRQHKTRDIDFEKPDAIVRFSDHRSYYLTQPFDAFRWLVNPSAPVKHATLPRNAEAIGRHLLRLGMRSYVVDVTRPEIRRMGLTVVRAVIPAAQPLWGGEHNRVLNLERLRQLARNHLLEIKDLNSRPLPFA